MTVEDITHVVTQSLEKDVDHFRKLALEASQSGDQEKCNEHLEKQKIAITELIELVNAYHASKK